MDQPQEARNSPRWPRRLALLFALLFAIFWSLGSFFFWSLFGLAAYFAFLSLYTASSVKASLEGFLSVFNRQRQAPKNPYQAFRPRTETTESPTPEEKIARIVRRFIIFFIALFLIFFIVGLFVGTPEGDSETVTTEAVEQIEEDDGTSYWNDRGNASLEKADYDSAFYYYDQALAIDAQSTFALYNKGLAYSLKQNYARSNGMARRCVQFHPDYNPAWWLLGYNYDLMNNSDSAVYSLEQAYRNGYFQPDFLQLMAEVYVKKDRRKDALEVYQRLVSMDTTKADVYRKMAELDPTNADAYRRKAKALDN